jgi:hypothetical protein
MEVEKFKFDAVLGKLLKAKPLPRAAIPAKKARRQKSDRPKQAEPESRKQ